MITRGHCALWDLHMIGRAPEAKRRTDAASVRRKCTRVPDGSRQVAEGQKNVGIRKAGEQDALGTQGAEKNELRAL